LLSVDADFAAEPLLQKTQYFSLEQKNLSIGILAALGAGLLWGLVFVAPLLLPNYPATLLTFGRYLAFGLVTLPIAWWFRAELRALTRSDWWIATKLSLIGNFLYYLALSAAIQMAGAPLPTLIIGTLPVVIAICSNLGGGKSFAWKSLAPSLVLIVAGLLFVNYDQLQRLAGVDSTTNLSRSSTSLSQYLTGAALAWVAVAAWTWYPIHNARWLQKHAQHSSMTWASAQGLVTLPIAAFGFAIALAGANFTNERFLDNPLGPQSELFVGLMFAIGLCASWLGTLLWNIASKNTPTALTGQLIVFETLAALGYAYIVYARAPSVYEAIGIALLVIGVMAGVRTFSRRAPVAT
jgi:drug/metabolite transporter (DMT)-like permease